MSKQARMDSKAITDLFTIAGALQDFRTEGASKATKKQAAELLAEYGWEEGIAYLAELEVLEELAKEDSDV